jgi:transposase-like protein
MSRVKRTFFAEFKTKVVLEIIEGKKTINEIASENSLQPNLIRNWKKEFMDKVSLV